ncbi:uncharacterized protein LOC110461110 [Mizuhopecten yessoensis]|uniref:Tetranectin-like protein n=1 Tax=Mizuhopecten yessoensis TaxID=6573 RepID=A0A210R391_MIZYE|nr:uncharacterized protein LOC110461110 [Mizuhopecten yessoensis]OWF55402.1 Tetranectin-like protein [Mizuhopecten yessoensis]
MEHMLREASTMVLISLVLVLAMFTSTVNCRGYSKCANVKANDPYQVVFKNNRCYHMVQDSISWNDAASACRARNGTLAIIRNSETNNKISQRATSLDSNDRANVSFYWIGGKVQTAEAAITWERDINGVAIVNPFTAYALNEPLSSGDRGCLLLDPGEKSWATDFCQVAMELTGYVCEYKPNGSESNLRAGMSKLLVTFLLTVVLGHMV